MKKKTLLFSLVAGMLYLGLTSYDDGAAFGGAGNCTGAKASVTNCSGGGGCHGGVASSVAIASIRVDSAGAVAVNQYVAGMTYTVTVTGSHPTYSKFGFQYAAVSGTGSSQIQAGTFTSLPSDLRSSSITGLNLIEHKVVMTGTGTPGTFSRTFNWTAPAATAGTVKMYLTLNAVNGDGNENAQDSSVNISKTLTLHTTSAVANIANAISVTTYPNPVTNTLNLQLNNTLAGVYAVTVYDLGGKIVASENIDMNSAAQITTISTANWNAGMYIVSIEKDGARQTTTIVKQ